MKRPETQTAESPMENETEISAADVVITLSGVDYNINDRNARSSTVTFDTKSVSCADELDLMMEILDIIYCH